MFQPEELTLNMTKVSQYLLNRNHPLGGPKSKVFFARGYVINDPERLKEDLLYHGTHYEPIETETNEYGTKYTVTGLLFAPDDPPINLVSVWIKRKGENTIRFVTAYPAGKTRNHVKGT